MELKVAVMLLFSVWISTCLTVSQSSGKKQTEALSGLYEIKLRGGTSIDRRQFNASDHHGVKAMEQNGMKEKDRIERLPGQPPDVRVKQYGGYVTVDQAAGRALYYYFVEAPTSDRSFPLLLWLNGGPGCSSLGYGAMEELGPFQVKSDGKTLYPNQFSWNQVANVLFLESPAGVGFSYSNTTADYEVGGDARTADDNYVFLVNWLERFPEFKTRNFYISGESYAGHYVPQLAQTILYRNQMANTTIINLKGIMIGNAVINDETDAKGMYKYFASHALISDENLDRILNNCDFSNASRGLSTECLAGLLEANINTGALDIYNIYAPTCANSSLTDAPNWTSANIIDPCIDDYVHAYMNRPEVQEAVHANLTKIPHAWEGCSNVIKKWKDSPSTVIPLLRESIAKGLRVWIYSGDVDGRVPVTSTKLSILQMKIATVTPWRPWYLDGQIGGYTQMYEGNVTFSTVRGAGHEVPMYQPARALSLIRHFIAGKQLPTSKSSSYR